MQKESAKFKISVESFKLTVICHSTTELFVIDMFFNVPVEGNDHGNLQCY